MKTVRFRKPTYVGDPINTLKIFNEKEVDELVLLDIGATRDQRPPDFSYLAELAGECFMPLCYGGGVRKLEDVRRILAVGFEKVVVNTHAVENPEFVRTVASEFGSQAVVASVDVRKSWRGTKTVWVNGGRRNTGLSPVHHALALQEMGAGELLLTSVDRDGTMTGYDLELTREVASRVTVPVIACGGAGSLADFKEAVEEGCASAVAAGSLFVFQGRHRAVLISYPEYRSLRELLG